MGRSVMVRCFPAVVVWTSTVRVVQVERMEMFLCAGFREDTVHGGWFAVVRALSNLLHKVRERFFGWCH